MKGLRRTVPWLALAALSLACGMGTDDPTRESDIPEAALSSGRSHLDCEHNASYCQALDRFEGGTPPVVRPESYSRIGRTISATMYGNTWDVRETVSWFVARRDSMAVGEVTPDNDTELGQLRELLATMRAGQPAPVDHPASIFVASLATGGEAPPRVTTIHGRSRHDHDGIEHTDTYYRQNGTEIIAVELSRDSFEVGVFAAP